MITYRLVHLPPGREIAVVTKADTWWAKGWGMLGRHELPMGEGLWLPGVASVHTIGVRFPLDLLFLDRELRTIKAAPNVPPGCWWIGAYGAAHTLELGAGTLAAHGLETQIKSVWLLERLSPLPC